MYFEIGDWDDDLDSRCGGDDDWEDDDCVDTNDDKWNPVVGGDDDTGML